MECRAISRRSPHQPRYFDPVKSLVLVVVLAGCGFQSNASQLAPIDGNDGTDAIAPATSDAAVSADASGPGRPDATMPPVPPDTQLCFGTGILTVCLNALPTNPVNLAGSATPFDTSVAANCTQLIAQTGGPELCMIAGTTVTVSGPLTAIGTRPLVLLGTAQVTVTTSGTIDVSSRISPRRVGAGAGTGTCAASGRGTSDSGGGGGGAGGSFGSSGGNGGAGNTGEDAVAGGSVGAPQPVPAVMRGGCSGGVGGDGSGNAKSPGGAAGDGGGGVYLIAGSKITIAGNVFASGAGGGATPTIAGREQGGGGGGTGGMIGLDAPTIDITGRVVANGGAGGGGGALLGGSPGGDGTTTLLTARAPGGTADVLAGAGADGTAQGVTTNLDGASAQGAGGGGAGGLGHVLTFGSLQGTLFSPSPTKHEPHRAADLHTSDQ